MWAVSVTPLVDVPLSLSLCDWQIVSYISLYDQPVKTSPCYNVRKREERRYYYLNRIDTAQNLANQYYHVNRKTVITKQN